MFPYCLNKIMEKAVKIQIVNYFTENNLFCKEQSAYLKFHSTSTALHDLVDNWLSNIENANINTTVILDLTKGFDIVSHEIMLYKLEKYGIINTAVEWFSSNLSDRTQRVKCNNYPLHHLSVWAYPKAQFLDQFYF